MMVATCSCVLPAESLKQSRTEQMFLSSRPRVPVLQSLLIPSSPATIQKHPGMLYIWKPHNKSINERSLLTSQIYYKRVLSLPMLFCPRHWVSMSKSLLIPCSFPTTQKHLAWIYDETTTHLMRDGFSRIN